MAKINRCVTVNGKKHWIRGNTEQEYGEKVAKLFYGDTHGTSKHPFPEYALNWFETYSKPNIESATALTYERQITRYLIPAFRELSVENITTDDVQRLFNGMDTAKPTKDKVKTVLNQILEAAVEDHLLERNPLKSRRIKITGRESKATLPYTVEQMRHLVHHLDDVQDPRDRAYLALQVLHPLRLEEVLGLQWGDLDLGNMVLQVNRAVTHPNRNQPEVKKLKTDASRRTIALAPLAAQYLIPGTDHEFVIGGDTPLSYQRVKKMCARIAHDTGFDDKITPRRFRTTVLTDLYSQTKDIKLTQEAAGHTTSAMTLKHYVKKREDISQAAKAVESLYMA